ncbi:MAG: DUF3093 domain-containing protein [Mycobacteriaceae bacterium]|nr:DUF3093 domain-containing protein [Mycobacteriaceae bacterium]MBV9512541.1 DUF3093 domain-containing protein [Mycobacteriaceae bacterium]
MPDVAPPELLFHEPGATWYWVLAGPVSALMMLGIEINSGLGVQLLAPILFLVLVSGFLAIQVKAARIHTSVELTRETLRQGTETIDVNSILRMFPEPESGAEPAKWQSSRALGELTGVPRGRTGIGLRLIEGRTVQAWARKHKQLRAALAELLGQESLENRPPGAAS